MEQLILTAPVRVLCGATYESNTENLIDIDGRPIYYLSNDNLHSDAFVGMDPKTMMNTLASSGILFEENKHEGAVVHMLGALPRFGKFGVTLISHDKSRLFALQEKLQGVLAELERCHTE